MKKLNVKKIAGKAYFAAAAAAIALTPSYASAQAPSAIVNRVADGLYGEFSSVAFKLALLAILVGLIGYFMTGDEHKKNKFKNGAIGTVVVLLVIAVLPGLLDWFEGLAL